MSFNLPTAARRAALLGPYSDRSQPPFLPVQLPFVETVNVGSTYEWQLCGGGQHSEALETVLYSGVYVDEIGAILYFTFIFPV